MFNEDNVFEIKEKKIMGYMPKQMRNQMGLTQKAAKAAWSDMKKIT